MQFSYVSSQRDYNEEEIHHMMQFTNAKAVNMVYCITKMALKYET